MKSRVVLLLTVFPQLSETFIVNQFLGLLDAGWDVHILCGSFRSDNWDAFEKLRTRPDLRRRVHASFPAQPRWLAALFYLPVLLFTLVRFPIPFARYFKAGWKLHHLEILRQFYLDAPLIWLRPALLHFEFGTLAVGRELLAQTLGCKMLVSFRGYDLNFVGLDDPDYYTKVWNAADAVHLLGQDLWKRAQVRGCPPEMRHFLIPPAVDADYFSPAASDVEDCGARPLRILSVGRLEWKKGYEFALQAVRALQKQNIPCEYRIIGDGPYLEALAFAKHQLGLTGTTTFLGSLPANDIRSELQNSDVLLHPSLSEGFCNAVLEAQAAAVAVVCSDAGSLPENIVDGETGFLVPRRDPAAIAARLTKLATDPQLRKRMGIAGRQRVLENFTPAKQIVAFGQLYHTLLDDKHAAN